MLSLAAEFGGYCRPSLERPDTALSAAMAGVAFNPHNPHYQESKERVPCMPESRRDHLCHALGRGTDGATTEHLAVEQQHL
jgi:hypothetical protein